MTKHSSDNSAAQPAASHSPLERDAHWVSDTYVNVPVAARDFAVEMLQKEIFSYPKAILDIGCGEGKTTGEMARLFPDAEITGVDSSDSMIDFANAHYADNVKLRFALMDAADLIFPNTIQFDLITSFFCLQWINDKKSVLSCVKKLLGKRGAFIAIIPIRHPLIHQRIPMAMITSKYWAPYFQDYVDPIATYDDVAYEQYAKQCGLAIDYCRFESVTWNVASRADLEAYLFAILPYMTRLPTSELKSLFMQELVDRYLEFEPVDAEGRCRINAIQIALRITHHDSGADGSEIG